MSLSSSVAGLADARHVFTRCGKHAGVDIAEHIRDVSRAAQDSWKSVRGRARPLPAAKIRAALSRVDAETAAVRMACLAAEDLVWNTGLRDPVATEAEARRVVRLLGGEAVWWSNQQGTVSTGREWSPVTDFTFDGVIAGVGATRFVVVLQTGED